jgi:hypothetical protein
MLTTNLAAAFLLGLTATAAVAQLPAAPSATRSGQAVAAGASSPQSDKASNNGPAGTKPTIAPTPPSPILASPALGNDAMSRDYLRAARAALVAGNTGEAQQSLEMAETRALGRPVVLGQANTPNASLYIARIADARSALGKGDSRYAISLIDVALLH